MNKPTKIAIASVLAVALVLGSSGGAVYASNSAKPGDINYPLDKAGEDFQRLFTFDPVEEVELELDVLQERIDELKELDSENSDFLENAANEVNQQQTQVQSEYQAMEENSKVDSGKKERILNRFQSQIEYHTQLMEQLQDKMGEKGNANAQEALGKALLNYLKGKNQAMESVGKIKDKKDSDDSSTDSEQENEVPGNSDNSNKNKNKNSEDSDSQNDLDDDNDDSSDVEDEDEENDLDLEDDSEDDDSIEE